MAAAVARVETSVRTSSVPTERRKPARARSRRKLRNRAWHATLLLLFLGTLCGPFVYTWGYATLAKTGYVRNDYEVLCWKEKVENQRLKVLLDRQSSYARIKAEARQLGMVRADRYDYVGQNQTIASR